MPGNRAASVLDLLLPVYHEQDNFPHALAEIERHVPPPFRLLVIYDYEEDPTVPVVRACAATRPWIELVRNGEGRGVIGALKTGVRVCGSGPVLVTMADLSDDLAIVPHMLALYRDGFDVVCPSRYMPGGRQLGGPRLKRLLSRLAGCSAYWLRGVPTHDITNNFRLYSGALLKELTIESTGGFEFALEVTAKAFHAGRRIAELPTTWRDRTAGQSRFRLFRWLPRYIRWYICLLGRSGANPQSGYCDK
jgi:glycosyltransferase involved in cell wall biosynthesis